MNGSPSVKKDGKGDGDEGGGFQGCFVFLCRIGAGKGLAGISRRTASNPNGTHTEEAPP